MTTITVTDLEGGMKGKLEGHLKSDDFFSVEKNPTATFIMTSVAPLADVKAGEPNFNVTGKLTIKGITNDVTFPAMIRFEGNTMTAKGDVKLIVLNTIFVMVQKLSFPTLEIKLSMMNSPLNLI